MANWLHWNLLWFYFWGWISPMHFCFYNQKQNQLNIGSIDIIDSWQPFVCLIFESRHNPVCPPDCDGKVFMVFSQSQTSVTHSVIPELNKEVEQYRLQFLFYKVYVGLLYNSPIRLMHWLLLCPLWRSSTPQRSLLSRGSCVLKPPSEETHIHALMLG